ncbi:MAG: penicillin acylase family protein [Pseudomonadota bacterium]
MKRLLWITPALVIAGAMLASCAVLQGPPGPTTFDARFQKLPTQNMPLEKPVTIHWSDEMVPFIEAETDADAAFALGVVHAHLRLAQLALARHIVTGRISEMAGPFTTDLDAFIRAIDFGRAASDIHDAMPPETRIWMDRFVDGINHYAAQVDEWPHDMQAAGIEWTPWTAEDTLTLARVSGININWRLFLQILAIEDDDLRETVLARINQMSKDSVATFGDGKAFGDLDGIETLQRVLALSDIVGKNGSNSMVVGPSRSASGSAMIANDPHLGFLIPNPWMIAGIRSPSYEMVGMMVPGTPVFGFGRNRNLAWGGTYLRAATGELVDVSGLPPEQLETVRHEIGVRFWFDEVWETKNSPYGPVPAGTLPFAEAPIPYAINWIGHRVTDETSALLGAMKAKTFQDFRAAMKTFAVPPQNFLVADRSGNIGSMVATTVPVRPPDDPIRIIVSPERSAKHWQDLYDPTELPFELNPPKGVLASANNAPNHDTTRPYQGIYGQDERIRRIEELLASRETWTVDTLTKLQIDTVSPLSRELIAALRPRLTTWSATTADQQKAIDLILAWDGDYAVDSLAAPVWEAFIEAFAPAVYQALGRADEGAVYKQTGRARRTVLDDMANLDEAGWLAALGTAVPLAGDIAGKGQRWGDIHQIKVGHILNNVPVLGGRYLERQIPVPGANATIFKTSAERTNDLNTANFGAQARHISDLADPDANYFILFGGQDGWIGSPAFTDQVDRWLKGGFIQLPLEPEALRRTNPHVVRLMPG